MTTSDIFANQRQVWKEHQFFYAIARRSLPFIIGVVIGGIIFAADDGYFTNLYTEILSIVATVGVLDYLNKRDRLNEKTQDLKQRLVDDARSSVNSVAVKAIEDLRSGEDWLTGDDGLLKEAKLAFANLEGANLGLADLTGAKLAFANLTGADLEFANLTGAKLLEANLEGADLGGANLTEAYLGYANLEGADLGGANLTGADLGGAKLAGANLVSAKLAGANLELANLEGAYLQDANLEEAYLGYANLEGAYLGNANLAGADLASANLEEANLGLAILEGADLRGAILENVIWQVESRGITYIATLPDGTKWAEDTDMGRFTDRSHPEFGATLGKINTIRKKMGLGAI